MSAPTPVVPARKPTPAACAGRVTATSAAATRIFARFIESPVEKLAIPLSLNPSATYRQSVTAGQPRIGFPCGIREHDRGFDLALRDAPVLAQQGLGLLPRQPPVAVLLVEGDRPSGIDPGAEQDRLARQFLDMAQKLAADALLAIGR